MLKLILLTGMIVSTLYGQQKLSVHGYLTQAYAVSSKYSIFGIPKEGTSDYRNLALQFRYEATDNSNFVIQLSHKRIGVSPVMKIEPDIKLDWAFFEYKFSGDFSIKLGKIQLPFGIYNEIRDVGILLPFYQVPYTPYGESNYMSETVDGFKISYEFFLSPDWIQSIDLYYGQWEWLEWFIIPIPFEQTVLDHAKMTNAYGAQTWSTTPVEGLRFGLGGYLGKINGGITFAPNGWLGSEKIYTGLASLDFTRDSYFLRTEYARFHLENNDISANSIYFQTGITLIEPLSLNTQASLYQILNAPSFVHNQKVDINYFKDFAVGLKYDFRYNIVLKGEFHWNKSFVVEKPIYDIADKPYSTNYFILSFSTSF